MNKFDYKVLRDFSEWVKTQPIYVGRRHIDGDKEILIVREGKHENAIEVYIKEEMKNEQ